MDALGIGDLHFDGPFTKLIPDAHKVIAKEVQKVLDWGKKRGIDQVFLYGDVCEFPRMSYESYREFSRLLRKNRKFTFHIILGNHDKFAIDPSAGHSLELVHDLVEMNALPNVRVYTEPTDVEIDGVGVRFLPWPHRAFSKSRLNVAHIETAGSKSDSGKLFDPEGLYKGTAVIVAGHLHQSQKVRNTYFSGTPFQQNFGEHYKKYFHHIRFESVDDYEIELVRTKPEYRLHSIVVKSKADVKTIPTSSNDLVKLIIRDSADVDASAWNGMSNVVKTTGYKSKEELATVLAADLKEGEQLTIDTTEFFMAWLGAQGLPESDQRALVKLRRSILRS